MSSRIRFLHAIALGRQLLSNLSETTGQRERPRGDPKLSPPILTSSGKQQQNETRA